jgi:hypothetical protein
MYIIMAKNPSLWFYDSAERALDVGVGLTQCRVQSNGNTRQWGSSLIIILPLRVYSRRLLYRQIVRCGRLEKSEHRRVNGGDTIGVDENRFALAKAKWLDWIFQMAKRFMNVIVLGYQ